MVAVHSHFKIRSHFFGNPVSTEITILTSGTMPRPIATRRRIKVVDGCPNSSSSNRGCLCRLLWTNKCATLFFPRCGIKWAVPQNVYVSDFSRVKLHVYLVWYWGLWLMQHTNHPMHERRCCVIVGSRLVFQGTVYKNKVMIHKKKLFI